MRGTTALTAALATAATLWLAPAAAATGGTSVAPAGAGTSSTARAGGHAPADAAAAKPAPGSAAAKAASSRTAAKSLAKSPAESAGRSAAKSTAPPRAWTKSDAEKAHAQAVRQTTAADSPDACSGALAPHTVYSCADPENGDPVYTLDLPRSKDVLFVQVVARDPFAPTPVVTAPDGTILTCDRPDDPQQQSYGTLRCPTAQAGTYTLTVPGAGFTVAWNALLSDAACTTLSAQDTALGAPVALAGSLDAGSPGDCYSLPLAAGDVLRSRVSDWTDNAWVYDADGTQVCAKGDGSFEMDCTLTGSAPYRVQLDQREAEQSSYTLSFARLSTPTGCPALDPQAYGTVPDASSTARCRTLHVTAAGPYVFGTAAADHGVTGALYRADGTEVCTEDQSTACALTAGDYTWARDFQDSGPAAYGVWFRAAASTDGCTAGRDDEFASGSLTGAFAGQGEELCWTLPTATGQGLYLLDQQEGRGAQLEEAVYDSAGARQCADDTVRLVCKLTGTAPFHLALGNTATGSDSGADTGSYVYTVQRTGSTSGCTAWPQSAFGGSYGAEVSLTAAQQMRCLALPADSHSTAEMLDFTNTSNRLDASYQVYDAAGEKVCASSGSSLTTCRFATGTAYQVLLVGTGYDDTYDVVRRDISSTASCKTPASLTVGGAATAYSFGSALDSGCLHVSAAATDKLWLSVRTPNPEYKTGADLFVADADGTVVCWQQGTACRVTGSTSYVIGAVASGYDGDPIAARVDTWKVGTAAGWVPQCTANQLSPDGFPVQSGSFTESASGYCAVMDLKPSQRFDVYGTDSDIAGYALSVDLLGTTGFAGTSINTAYQCAMYSPGFHSSCLTDSSAPAGQYILVISADHTTAPVEYSVQGVCSQGCSTQHPHADVTSLSPATGKAGTATQVVVHGSDLTLGTDVELASNGVPPSSGSWSSPVSVSADGTSLTVLLNPGSADPGDYDVVVDQPGYSVGTKSTGYLPDGFTVTPAATASHGRFVPVTPTRLLDTRNGTGAPKAQVGAGKTVRLTVAGAHGVPASGVTAVTMNVTAVQPTTTGHITVYPDGQQLPSVSSVSYQAGHTIANLVTVPVHNGVVDLENSAGTVDLLADVTGYYTDGGNGSALTTITPTRFLDTRNGTGAPKAQVGAGKTVRLTVAGAHGVPASGVTAVTMNVTAVHPTTTGHITVYPDGQQLPSVSSVSYGAGRTIANLVTVPVHNGVVDLENSAGTVDLLADVSGYFSTTGSAFTPVDPVRLLDTRSGLGARAGQVGPGATVSFEVDGVDGVPTDGLTAVALNVTATAPSANSHLTVYPHGTPLPGVSNLNYPASTTIANQVVVPVVDGRISLTNYTGDVQVIADLDGYYGT
ncbi:hypothetical protein AB0399_00255 [Streptomyces sp. NPDC088194]|uniref:hypothetical protein n=1 Tax=Streptomyces sp. NPDC088194 TaxID=3154931 RepID=UPI00344DFA2B